jgi:archaeosine-15-forming tRNA-guanine transglycosylase
VSGVLVLPADGPPLRTEQDAADVIGQAWSVDADTVVVPVERLDDGFWTLSTRIAGAVIGKFATYRMRVVVAGDISDRLAASPTLRAFVSEANRGREVSFVDEFTG